MEAVRTDLPLAEDTLAQAFNEVLYGPGVAPAGAMEDDRAGRRGEGAQLGRAAAYDAREVRFG